MIGYANRREVTRWMLSAALGGLVKGRLKASSTTEYEPVSSRIHQAIERGEATGVGVALVRGGRIAWEEGFGWANREASVKVTARTPFSMASITKPFTATTLMILAAEGRLSLDEPANKYLADSKIIGINGDAEAATVRLLGAHASGLPGIFESYDVEEARLVPTPNAVIHEYGRLAYPPASCYEYSNIGFAALNAIASALTQTELGVLMHRKVLGPLGLNDSFFGTDAIRVKNGAARYDPQGRLIPHTEHRLQPLVSCMRALTILPVSPYSTWVTVRRS
jgi:CubicO group peptidase (beta-lactamase class C family)